MKKMFFWIFLLFFLGMVQILTSQVNQIFTFHSKEERTIVHWIEKDYLVLEGTLDENIGSRPKAIYRVVLQQGYERYIVLARERETSRDYLLMIDPLLDVIEYRHPLNPYFCVNQSPDFRGLMDLNNDGNLEMVCVVTGNAGKRIKIVKMTKAGLIDLAFPFLESFGTILVEDTNIDGVVDIICFQNENGINQPPMFFKLQGNEVVRQDPMHFPAFLRKYDLYLRAMKKRTEKAGNPSIAYDLQIAHARLYFLLGQEKEFHQLEIQMNTASKNPDITQKIRLYRMRIIQAYFLLQKGEESQANQVMNEATDYISREGIAEQARRSIVEAEKVGYFLTLWEWNNAVQSLKQALMIDPNSAMAQKLQREMGNP